MHDRKGKGSGLVIVLILLVALLIVFLAVKQMQSAGFGDSPGEAMQSDPVEQAQDAVDVINDRMQQAGAMTVP